MPHFTQGTQTRFFFRHIALTRACFQYIILPDVAEIP